jgi:hypothetical protein
MKHPIKYTVICLTSILFASLASAEVLKSDEHNYGITVPEGWTVDFQNSAGFTIHSPDKKKNVVLLIRKGATKLDPASMSQFEQGMSQAGAQTVLSTNLTLDGIPAHETVQTIGTAAFATSVVILMSVADGKYYHLQGMHFGGDVTRDSDIQEAFASFHFLQPPKPSVSSRFGSPGMMLAVAGVIIVGLLFWVVWKRAAS